jgi:hypothetical protein
MGYLLLSSSGNSLATGSYNSNNSILSSYTSWTTDMLDRILLTYCEVQIVYSSQFSTLISCTVFFGWAIVHWLPLENLVISNVVQIPWAIISLSLIFFLLSVLSSLFFLFEVYF